MGQNKTSILKRIKTRKTKRNIIPVTDDELMAIYMIKDIDSPSKRNARELLALAEEANYDSIRF